MTIVLKPAFLGAVMKHAKNTPPGANPAKLKYLRSDLRRARGFYGVDLEWPPVFPFDTLLAMRVLASISVTDSDFLAKSSTALWQVGWMKKQLITPENIASALDPILGSARVAVHLAAAETNEIRLLLQNNTEEATELGAFGMPWIRVQTETESECYFGSDRFEAIAFQLGLEWKGPNPGAVIKGQAVKSVL